MGSGFAIRARRRTAAQQLALLQVKREISATDPHGRLKYVRDFSEAFRDYRRAFADADLRQQYSAADILLVGDYHALAASQGFAAPILRPECSRFSARPILRPIICPSGCARCARRTAFSPSCKTWTNFTGKPQAS